MPKASFSNLYGPTEVTDICTYYTVDRPFGDEETLPIGKACNNCHILVLKEDNTEAMEGEDGELCVRGSFLAMGYYNNPGKTKESFVQNPLNSHYPELIYRTGDLVRRNSKGELLYLTRKDFQIKRMGYRIELGEIEAAAGSLQEIKACACIYRPETEQLLLFYEGSRDSDQIRRQLSQKLPRYMQPGRYIRLSRLPHNSNGKIDRKQLQNLKPNEQNI